MINQSHLCKNFQQGRCIQLILPPEVPKNPVSLDQRQQVGPGKAGWPESSHCLSKDPQQHTACSSGVSIPITIISQDQRDKSVYKSDAHRKHKCLNNSYQSYSQTRQERKQLLVLYSFINLFSTETKPETMIGNHKYNHSGEPADTKQILNQHRVLIQYMDVFI